MNTDRVLTLIFEDDDLLKEFIAFFQTMGFRDFDSYSNVDLEYSHDSHAGSIEIKRA